MNRVFIVGAGIVSPIGNDLAAFFSSLQECRSGIKNFSRFDTDRLVTRQGGEVDLSTLSPPPRLNGKQWDPIQDTKIFLAWNALKQLSVPADRKFCPLFCSIGLERVDIAVLMQAPPKLPVCPEYPPTLLPELLAANLGLDGPVFNQASACAAGTIAIGSAFRSLRSGVFSSAIAGGVDSMISPYGVHAFNSLGALSERNDLGPAALAPFDVNRSGTLLGEGSAFFLLQTEREMARQKRSPMAEIVGFGGSTDAFHPVMPDPNGAGAVQSMRAAIRDAKVDRSEISYINAHGTGTRQNDSAEAKAVLEVFGTRDLPISSNKPFFGHLLSAAGAVEVAACLLSFSDGIVPPTLHVNKVDPECDIDCVPNQPRKLLPKFILKNSYGFGGQNASIILKNPKS